VKRAGTAVAACLLAVAALAQVPAKLGYQGRLKNRATGAPMTGVQQVVFALYKDANGGTPLWSETQQLAFTDGYYATFLNVNPADFDGADRWLETSIAGAPLGPRQRMGSVGYALHSGDVINTPVTYSIGPDGGFPDLETALGVLASKVLRATVKLELMPGTHTLPAGGLTIDHPDGKNLQILGPPDAGAVLTQPAGGTGNGITVAEGRALGALDRLTLQGVQVASTTGVVANAGSLVKIGPTLRIAEFPTGVICQAGSVITANGVTVSSTSTAAGYGFLANTGCTIHANGATSTGFVHGYLAQFTSTIWALNAVCNSPGLFCFFSQYTSFLYAVSAIARGVGSSGWGFITVSGTLIATNSRCESCVNGWAAVNVGVTTTTGVACVPTCTVPYNIPVNTFGAPGNGGFLPQ
jgi:hypothetical protein